ncbi:16S rRNA (cytosine(1402)-N(4))-methyltransferase, partial [Patescibacteria group bacterium]|nr:16S rRNA (cytosine(1402)-N(4))-methyltransferase [Patescibacteria group bacterium]
ICHHKKKINIINKKPIIPKDEEIKNNIRSRSSKLRILEKI